MEQTSNAAKDLVEETANRIELAIVTGDLQPGQKLSEQALSERFGISRGPLREAIRTLEGRRLLTRRPYAGVSVVQLSLVEIEQLLVMREALEGMAARYAAENMTLPEVRALREFAVSLRDALAGSGDGQLWRGGTENEFHRRIIQASRNKFIEDAVCRDMFPLLRIIRFQTSAMTERRSRIGEEHMKIISAIERRLPDEAERLMRQHIAGGRESLLNAIRGRKAPGADDRANVPRKR